MGQQGTGAGPDPTPPQLCFPVHTLSSTHVHTNTWMDTQRLTGTSTLTVPNTQRNTGTESQALSGRPAHHSNPEPQTQHTQTLPRPRRARMHTQAALLHTNTGHMHIHPHTSISGQLQPSILNRLPQAHTHVNTNSRRLRNTLAHAV